MNPAVQLWETALFGVGLRTVLGIPWRRAMVAGAAASVVYILGASRFLRRTQGRRPLDPTRR